MNTNQPAPIPPECEVKLARWYFTSTRHLAAARERHAREQSPQTAAYVWFCEQLAQFYFGRAMAACTV